MEIHVITYISTSLELFSFEFLKTCSMRGKENVREMVDVSSIYTNILPFSFIPLSLVYYHTLFPPI